MNTILSNTRRSSSSKLPTVDQTPPTAPAVNIRTRLGMLRVPNDDSTVAAAVRCPNKLAHTFMVASVVSIYRRQLDVRLMRQEAGGTAAEMFPTSKSHWN